MGDREDLAAFIEDLRAPHAAGEFRGQADWRIVPGIILGDVEFAIGRMLDEVEYYRDLLPENRRAWAGPRHLLAQKLLGLRRYLRGERVTEAERARIRMQNGIGD